MASSLGPSWRSSFTDFNPIPFAAASIGQVHHAVLAAAISPTGQPERVAVKVQFPNIAESVASDLSYIRILLTAGRLLPRGLFLDKTLAVLYPPRPVIMGGIDDDLINNATGHEGGIGGRMQLYARGGLYALFRELREARRRHALQSPVGMGRKYGPGAGDGTCGRY